MAAPVTVRWVTHPELSIVHAAYTVATGARCVDPKTEQLLVKPVTGINTRLISSSIDVGEFWHRYRSEFVDHDGGNRACSSALLAAGCSELQIEQTSKAISSLLSECRLSVDRRFPKLSEQLELRARPLKERWGMAGPGLLRDVQQQIWKDSPPEDWWPTRIDGLLVQPMRGGDGGFESASQRFWIEAMLTDVDRSVPEVLRVAWLITRLAMDAHLRGKAADRSLSRAWSLASVPLLLSAGVRLDLIDAPSLPISAAIDLWNMGDSSVSSKLEFWWQSIQGTETPLPVCVSELDRMFQPSGTDNDESQLGI